MGWRFNSSLAHKRLNREQRELALVVEAIEFVDERVRRTREEHHDAGRERYELVHIVEAKEVVDEVVRIEQLRSTLVKLLVKLGLAGSFRHKRGWYYVGVVPRHRHSGGRRRYDRYHRCHRPVIRQERTGTVVGR